MSVRSPCAPAEIVALCGVLVIAFLSTPVPGQAPVKPGQDEVVLCAGINEAAARAAVEPGVKHPPSVKLPSEMRVLSVDLTRAVERCGSLAKELNERFPAGLGLREGGSRPGAPSGSVDFETMDLGEAPAGFTVAQTGDGTPCRWVVLEDPTAPSGKRVVMQTTGDIEGHRFPMCIYDGASLKDVNVAVRFKALTGESDRAGGLVVRYQDKDNYYCVRTNALEDNIRLYHVVDGRRRQFAGVDHHRVDEGVWHSLRLEVCGAHFRVWMDGSLLFEADDDTFTAAGKVGMWLKGDSVSCFDDFTFGPPAKTRTEDFEKMSRGAAPGGMESDMVGVGDSAAWVIVSPPEAQGHQVVKAGPRGSDGSGRNGCVLLLGGEARDVSAQTRFRSGADMAGLVVRYQDDDDFYYVRINPQESNARLYHMRGGERRQIGEAHHLELAENDWHLGQLDAIGNRLSVLVDGKRVFEVVDDGIKQPGRAGLWTTPGSETLYDDVTVTRFE